MILASADVDPARAAFDPPTAGIRIRHEWRRFWTPRRLGWWIAVLFMIGSGLFATGGAMGTWPAAFPPRRLDPTLIGWIFFVGSLFFTAAAYLQWLQALNHDVADAVHAGRPASRRWQFLGWRGRSLGYLASLVQLAGTLLFNLNTADALLAGLDWQGQDLLIWTPDVVGSICFLVASQLAVMEVAHRYWFLRPRTLSGWIAQLNMLGSVLFMVSAVASFVEPGTSLLAPWLANFGTFAGALCFLVGAYLLIPEMFEVTRRV